ncbi:DUF302 domain-containing protein [Streptomyces sp. NBC_00316]|uniref:DUF302 domain-containing protein n=1 Tax=Streptomyces sp. NBC_00316 TaxID=2975710 RepID=UPI002E27E496|nr:DUF302 domain-containing protein [Streptomyces sp. NBC_00316]
MASTPTTADWSAENYEARRLTIAAGDYDDLLARFESIVPTVPMAAVDALIERGADWDEMLELIDKAAPYGFLVYARIDVGPTMASAGDGGRGVEYLMGNHTIAERMYRHDQRAMLYAPLRLFLYETPDGKAYFALDQPSPQLGSFGDERVLSVGRELDAKVAALLGALGLPVPAGLLGQDQQAPARPAASTPGD